MGHEICGIVESLGGDLDPNKESLKVGDKVVAFPWLACRKCDACRADNNTFCDNNVGGYHDVGMGCRIDGQCSGGYSSHVVLPDTKFALKIPDGIPMEIATMLPCSGITTFNALKRVKENLEFGLQSNERPTLLIIGMGGLGSWCTILARHVLKLDVRILCADVMESKRQMAFDCGADNFIAIDRGMPLDEMASRIKEMGHRVIYAAIDFVGRQETGAMAIRALRRGGKLLVIGLAGGVIPISLPVLVAGSLTVQGSRTGTIADLRELLHLVATTYIKYPKVENFNLEDVNTILKRMRRGDLQGRALLDFTKE